MASYVDSEKNMNIGIIGVGRLGLCFALLLDRGGYRVMASDIRTNYIAALNRGQIKTNEPRVVDMLSRANIQFTTDSRSVIQASDIIYVMVATPSLADGKYDVSAVDRVINDVEECDFDISAKILVIGCTTNPKDCQRFQDRLRPRGVSVLYNPEFIAQGSIIKDLENADMVLIGGEDADVIDRYKTVYDKIQISRAPNIHTMSLTAAELVKIGINCYLTTKISYANMLGEVLIRSGFAHDVQKALSAVGADSRVGSKYMKYGFGFGGPCLPRDNRAFANYAQSIGLDFPLGHIVDRFNKNHANFMIQHLVDNNPENLPYYFRSITYKPGTDITEESQQLAVCVGLLRLGYTVYIEPSTMLPAQIIDELTYTFGPQCMFNSRQYLDQMQITYMKVDQ